MNRARFEHLLEAYGADFSRWPADERAAAEAFARAHAAEIAAPLAEARALDALLDTARTELPDTSLAAARIMRGFTRASAPVFNQRVLMALAASAMLGVLIGYGGGRFAPAAAPAQEDLAFAQMLEAPFSSAGDEG